MWTSRKTKTRTLEASVAGLPPTEIKALVRIVSELDYYQLLHLRRGAVAGDIRRAYHDTSRTLHPDVHRSLAPDLRDAVDSIAKRVCEAYSVLRDPRRRQAYDRHLEDGHGVRMQLAQAQAEAGRHAELERSGRTPQGRQYCRLAEADTKRRDYAAAARNLQTALTFEPDNELIKARLAEAREKLR